MIHSVWQSRVQWFAGILGEVRQVHQNGILSVVLPWWWSRCVLFALDVWGKVPSSEPICPCVSVPSEGWWILKYSNNRAWSDRTALWCDMKTFYWIFSLFEKVHVWHNTLANSVELDWALYSKLWFTTNHTDLYKHTFYISWGCGQNIYKHALNLFHRDCNGCLKFESIVDSPFKFKFKFKLSFIVIPLHVWTYSGTRCRASQDHGAT